MREFEKSGIAPHVSSFMFLGLVPGALLSSNDGSAYLLKKRGMRKPSERLAGVVPPNIGVPPCCLGREMVGFIESAKDVRVVTVGFNMRLCPYTKVGF